MSPRTRTIVFSLLPVVVVVVAAYAFYYLNSEVKTGAVLNSTFRQSTPLVLAAMCGLLGERTGVVNIGIEGQLLMSAFTGFYTAAATGNIWVGALAGVISGMVLGLFLALLRGELEDRPDHRRHGHQHLRRRHHVVPVHAGQAEPPGGWTQFKIPGLSGIPLIGPSCSRTQPIAYLAIVLVFVLHVGLFRTRWGLRTRAVGEHPLAADTVGISVVKFRYLNVVAGRRRSPGSAAPSSPRVRAALRAGDDQRARVHRAGGDDLRRVEAVPAWGGALLFGFTTAMAAQLQFDQVIDVPPQFINILPYVLVIIVLAVFSGKVRPAGRRRQAVREGMRRR